MDANDHSDSSSDDALRDLARAEELAARTAARGRRWVRIYLTTWAIASVGLLLAIGLGSQMVVIVAMSLWALLVVAGVVFSAKQGVAVTGAGGRLGTAAGLWAAVYAGSLALGVTAYTGEPWFWFAAGVLSAVPLLVAAWAPWRSSAGAARAGSTR
ncbi:hypothetical protein CZ771_08730 [Actinomycetales bacterium JB111]|nr:hypothetical protein CZ771_08730 [Actinomycetales bacterium JB111]